MQVISDEGRGRLDLTIAARRDLAWLLAACVVGLIVSLVTSIDDAVVELVANVPIIHNDVFLLLILAIGLIVFASRRWMEERRYAAELRRALADVDTLTGLIPICASCKRIRSEQDYWEAVEQYVASRSRAEFTHALCPDCAARMWAEYEQASAP